MAGMGPIRRLQSRASIVHVGRLRQVLAPAAIRKLGNGRIILDVPLGGIV